MTILEVDDIHVSRGNRIVVRGVTLRAEQGELLALMGPSGAGKTTVLRAIAGLDPVARGRIRVGEITIGSRHLDAREVRAVHRQVGFVFQFHHLFANMDVLHNVMLAPVHVLKRSPDASSARAQELLQSLGVAHRASAMPHQLSGGEAQRVAIARALAVDPPLLLMDEPTASLDPGRRGELATTLKALAAEGRTIVLATHDEEFVRACVQRVITIE